MSTKLGDKPTLITLTYVDKTGHQTLLVGSLTEIDGVFYATATDHPASIQQGPPVRLDGNFIHSVASLDPDTRWFKYQDNLT